MRSMTRTLSGLGLLLAVSLAGAQQPALIPPAQTSAPKKSALEEALDLALKNNPDLRVAASKLALAEAELSRTRLQVTQKVAAAYADVLAERAVLDEMERQLSATRKVVQSGAAPTAVLTKAEMGLSERKTKLAASERELTFLQGKGGKDEKRTLGFSGATFADFDGDGYLDLFITNTRLVSNFTEKVGKTDATEKLRQSLQKKATLSGQKVTLTEYLAMVRKTAGGINVHAKTKGEAWNETIDFDFEDVTIGGMLQFLEDSLVGHQIIVREYGLLIVAKDKVPAGASTLASFLRAETPKAAQRTDTGLVAPLRGR